MNRIIKEAAKSLVLSTVLTVATIAAGKFIFDQIDENEIDNDKEKWIINFYFTKKMQLTV